jgi:hypothetical protein
MINNGVASFIEIGAGKVLRVDKDKQNVGLNVVNQRTKSTGLRLRWTVNKVALVTGNEVSGKQ